MSSPNNLFDHLLESSHRDDSNKWSNIKFGVEMDIIEIKIGILSGALHMCPFMSSVDPYCSFHIRLSKAFWWLIFYYLFFRTETFMMCVNLFLYNQKRNFSWIGQKTKIFPIDHHYKNFQHL